MDDIIAGTAMDGSQKLMDNYDRLIQLAYQNWQYHFEFLNLGYAAYLVFYELCKQCFPDISDQAVAQMVSGIDVVLFRPDEELKRLAAVAVELGVGDAVRGAADEAALEQELAASEAGAQWLADWRQTKAPWFNYSNGNGFYHHHRSWIDDPAIPLLDRVVGSGQPAASTWKLAVAGTALDLGVIRPDEYMPIPCTGGLFYGLSWDDLVSRWKELGGNQYLADVEVYEEKGQRRFAAVWRIGRGNGALAKIGSVREGVPTFSGVRRFMLARGTGASEGGVRWPRAARSAGSTRL